MNTESKVPTSPVTETVELEAGTGLDVNTDNGAPLALPTEGSTAEILNQVLEYLSLDKALGLFNEYKQPITTAALLIGGIIVLKVALAVLGAINEVPLLEPTFEIVGIGYSAWFIYRFLLQADTRSELLGNIKNLKSSIFGK
jgi:CAAD domains of cyanobacterial aminoacyl-tRNA synthetase